MLAANTYVPLASQRRTPHATIDFETKSVAGHVWNEAARKWQGPPQAPKGKKGLPVVGTYRYAEHPSTQVLTLSFYVPGWGRGRWRPGLPLPKPLFDWIAAGGLVECHKAMFERAIWVKVCQPRYGFPALPPEQLSCSMATAHVYSYPGSLGDLSGVLDLKTKKNADGRRLLNKFSSPRNPTKADPRLWITVEDDPEDAENLYRYCDDDVEAEMEASSVMPPMVPDERDFWLIDQEINWRGIGIDRKGVRDCIAVLNQALARYGEEFQRITGGLEPTQLEKLKGWLAAWGLYVGSLDAEHLEELLKRKGLPDDVRRVLQIRDLIGSASVKKLYAMENSACDDDRLRDLLVHHGARTGRPTGKGAQPLNMPRAGPKLATCDHCKKPFAPSHTNCPWCQSPAPAVQKLQWKPFMADHVLAIMAYRSLDLAEFFFGDAVFAILGCLRSLFVAAPDHDLIASDYSAIEAVVTAMLAGEEWRIQAFRDKVDIYLASASRITGTTVETYLAYERDNGEHHPDRQKIGKVAELGLGFGGWITAWRQFDDSDTFTDAEVKALILAWRAASPSIVELWGGQWRGTPWDGFPERFGFEGAAINAVQYPGAAFYHAGIKFQVEQLGSGPALIVTLLSGRPLTYHDPKLTPATRQYASPGELQISYMTWNTNPKYGPLGWVRMTTYGSRLCENIVQAIAHDLLRFAIRNLRAHGFPTVLHVYDEIVGEIPSSTPDWALEVFETIMAWLPPWAAGWPVRASGGWRGRRYRKA